MGDTAAAKEEDLSDSAAKTASRKTSRKTNRKTTRKTTTKKATAKKEPKPKKYPECFAGLEPPTRIWRNRRIGEQEVPLKDGTVAHGVLHLAGVGARSADVMLVSPSATREEVALHFSNKPSMMRGPAASLLQRNLSRCGFSNEDWFYTAIARYNKDKLKLTSADINWGMPALDREIRTIQPKIIVCLGKQVFDVLSGLKFNMKEIAGGFFWSETYQCQLYPMDTVLAPLFKPEQLERVMVDLRAVREELDRCRGCGSVEEIEPEYRKITCAGELQELMDELKALQDEDRLPFLSIDCEWQGQTAWDGSLRSFQIAWREDAGAFIRLMNTDLEYCFDVRLQGVHDIIAPVFDNPKTRFIGHNFAADSVWLKHHLGIETYRRCGFDTMFAMHTIDENADLKLERMSLRYTSMGRYDIPLLKWKKNTKKKDFDPAEGYGRVPDRILVPYSINDCLVPMQAMRSLMGELMNRGLFKYYYELILPFVTDGFVEMMECGLPVNWDYLNEMREAFNRNQQRLLESFRNDLLKRAQSRLWSVFQELDPRSWPDLVIEFEQTRQDILHAGGIKSATGRVKRLGERFKSLITEAFGAESLAQYYPIYQHWLESAEFNIDSTEQLARWLFEVNGYEPLKTTKKDGIQMAWERVKQMPADRQAQFSPSVDKQTIHILADQDSMVARIEEIKHIASITKSFLSMPDENNNEKGIHKWIQFDGRVHANFALTETGRPRTWAPNVLNWPKNVAKPIEKAFERINEEYGDNQAPVSLRSNIQAPEGWAIVEMDLKTAEVVALAYIAGDDNMIRVLTESDIQFGIWKDDPGSDDPPRLCFNNNAEYSDELKTSDLIDTGEEDSRLMRHEDGSLVHPKRDLHWEICEELFDKPREHLSRKRDRGGAGKVANFSIPYGASPTLLERMIEVQTGSKPEEGTGQNLIDRYENRYPVAAGFLRYMERQVEDPGWYRSISGRVRRFKFNELITLDGLSDRLKDSIRSPLIRQARNFPIQEIVAATTAHASLQFISQCRESDLRSRIMILLYDAVALLAPLEELQTVVPLLRSCLTDRCRWEVNERTLEFGTDLEVMFRWGVKPTEEEQAILDRYLP